MSQQAGILLVDDREDSLLALEAILAPLGHRLVKASSGADALREILLHDFACVLLDVEMPEMDGYETARVIKQRRRSQHVPIVFVTALPEDDERVFEGYSVGAVDYIFKPVDPDILRSKVGVFVELWQKTGQLRTQEQRLHEQELRELERASETRYEQLADAMPQIVWRADVDGNATYFNRRWFEYTGMAPVDAGPSPWGTVVHSADLGPLLAHLRSSRPFELEFRIRGESAGYRWHLARTAPIRDPLGRIESWVGTATDIHDRKLTEQQWSFLLDAGDVLSESLDYRSTLAKVARLAVAKVSDWCTVHVVEANGAISEVAVAHSNPTQVALARELQERYPPHVDDASGPAAVIRTGEAELVPSITSDALEQSAVDQLHAQLLRHLEMRSYMCVPLTARAGVIGAMTFASSEPERAFGVDDLRLAQELAQRAASAIENARLYRQAEERAEAARVLATIGDGVFLLDRSGRIRLWNSAAERITGLQESDVLGRPAASAIPGWADVGPRIAVAGTGETPAVKSMPLEIDGREVWLSASAVGFEDGVVYAFRDLTEERRLESMRQDLVATVSHELRTPLAAIYGAALTLRREDIDLEEEMQSTLLHVITDEAARLSDIVNDLLLASQLDAGKLKVEIEPCDALEIVRAEVEAAGTHAPETVELSLEAPPSLPPVAADPGQLRQVVANLLDNAIKYSPAGGPVRVTLAPRDGTVVLAIADSGLGIPPDEQRRIFEKFYRLDPDMTGGIGGTGLGLYICRELVRRVEGRIWVESTAGRGSTFFVEIPQEAAVPAGGGGDAAATIVG